ncbi:MAG: 4-hydroxy-3-methylbut-2-enyl diphosphate reductase [Gemmatimonadota bacterium]|nr:MAG: 4-hydroxy-3-methylbut-2-enyl diphosphate reductase [Gemmatimonadota bacterium]
MAEEKTYFRTGLGLKKAVLPVLEGEYHSNVVDRLRERGYRASAGGLTIQLAEEFGYCYGVDRAVQYAYEARHKFPDRRLFLVGEIIHNPHVNARLRDLGIEFLMPRPAGGFNFSELAPDDVVIIPAFGVTMHDFQALRDIGCLLVDTTCGSVLNVWKRVEGYARDGFTSIIHGKFFHEETKATASQVRRGNGGAYLIVRDSDEARVVCDYILHGGDSKDFLERFGHACSEGFDPDKDLEKVGVANQTTMLASETVKIALGFRTTMIERYGEVAIHEHYRHFDTLCSATQDRQDAVLKMMETPPDIMIVLGGYNSSNTNHLAQICARHTRTYHLEDATCIDPLAGSIAHKIIGSEDIVSESGWLPVGDVEIGLTAGASTPNNKIGDTVERILATRGLSLDEWLGPVVKAD